MRRKFIVHGSGFVAAMVACLLAGCDPPPSQPEAPAPAVPEPTAPAAAAPTKGSPTGATLPSKAGEPAILSMRTARSSAKAGVPVELHYQFDGDVTSGRPVTLHLAAVPSVEGSNLTVSFKQDPGIKTTGTALMARKASASTAYRQQLSVTKAESGPAELRVLVTMDLPEGSAFGWFGVPLGGESVVEKKVKAPQE